MTDPAHPPVVHFVGDETPLLMSLRRLLDASDLLTRRIPDVGRVPLMLWGRRTIRVSDGLVVDAAGGSGGPAQLPVFGLIDVFLRLDEAPRLFVLAPEGPIAGVADRFRAERVHLLRTDGEPSGPASAIRRHLGVSV